MSLSAGWRPVAECAAELVLSQRWPAVSLSAGAGAQRWLLGALLLALHRRGVFTSLTADGEAAPGTTGTMLVTPASLVSVDNSRARPLLVVALEGASEEDVRSHAHLLVGALVYDVPSGRVYRAARYADVGPPVQYMGTCGNLSDAIREPKPLGWQDVRVVNKTYNILTAESYDRELATSPFTVVTAIRQTAELLEEAMGFKSNDLNMTGIRFIDVLAFFKNGTIDFMPDYFGHTFSRRDYMRFPHPLLKTEGVMFIATPPLMPDSGLGGVFSSGAGLALLAGTGLLLVLACHLLLAGAEPGPLAGAEPGPLATVLSTVRVLCNQGLTLAPARRVASQYVAGAVVCLAALLVCQFYTAGLLSRITTGRRRLPSERPEDLLLSADWQSVIYNGSVSQEFLLARYRDRPDFVRAISRLSRQPTDADEPWAQRAERSRFVFFSPMDNWQTRCSAHRCPRLCWYPQPIYTTRSGMPFRRGLPEEDAWRLALLRVRETGLWQRLLRRQVPVLPGSPITVCDLAPQPRDHVSSLSLHSCQQAFTVLLAGAAAAVLLLLGELLLARLTRRHDQKHKVTRQEIGLNQQAHSIGEQEHRSISQQEHRPTALSQTKEQLEDNWYSIGT